MRSHSVSEEVVQKQRMNSFRRENLQDGSNIEEGPVGPPSSSQTQTSSLDWDTRVQYFIGFFCLSMIASFFGSGLLLSGKMTGFCVLTSVSSALSLFGTFFLAGPLNQLRKMFDSNRWLASMLYVGSIVFTLISGLVLRNPPLAIIFVVLQYVAMAWYSLSYIPYARQLVSRLLCSCF